jgi:WD40 repeat protein/DNA-binding SARP family transcriptional activator
MLNLRFFGTVHLTFSDGGEPAIATAKAKALLAYLVTESDRPHLREQLAALLWPEADSKAAAQNLRQALYDLRRRLTPQLRAAPSSKRFHSPYLTVTRQDVAFNFDSDYWCDVETFKALMAAVHQHPHPHSSVCPTCAARLEEAVALYTGDFLAGLTLPDAEKFEEWRRSRAESFRAQAIVALKTLVEFHERRRNYGAAQQFLLRFLELEPWDEEAHRHMMRLLALNNQRIAAIEQFEKMRRLLAEELGVEPSPDTVQLFHRIERGLPLTDDSIVDNPYKGLYPFSLADSADFYGREEAVDYLLRRLETHRAVFLIGPSGSGKSSVIRAGVLPALLSLRQIPISTSGGPHPERVWTILDVRPGADPFRSFAEALVRQLAVKRDIADLARLLSEEGATLHHLSLRFRSPRVLIFVDQFEELYTLCPVHATRRAFIDFLLRTASTADENPHISLLVSMRADFTGQALAHRELADALQAGGIVLGPMRRDELRRAIEEPARNRGVTFEPGLVDRLLDDVGESPGNLPLLQFALSELWLQRSGWQITHDAYDAIGGVAGALARYADQVYQGLSPEEQTAARRLFVQLVQPGEETGDTRRPALRSELEDSAWALAQKLADLRLVVAGRSDGEESIELVHEALIRHWSLLREWMDEDRDFRRWQQRLRTFLQHWLASGRGPEDLLRGLSLTEAVRWSELRRADLSRIEQEFIDASVEEHQRRLKEQERLHRQELERAQRLAEMESQRAEEESRRAEQEHRVALRLRRLTVALTLVSLTTIAAALLAFLSRQEAQRFAQVALARQLAAQSLNFADDAADLALLLSVEALERMTDPAEQTALLAALPVNAFLDRFFWGSDGDITQIVVAPDESRILCVEEKGGEATVRLWDAASGRSVGALIPSAAAATVTIAPNATLIASSEGTAVQLWSGVDGQWIGELLPRVESDDVINLLQFTLDGSRLLAKTIQGAIIVWDVESQTELQRFFLPSGRDAVTLSPDGRLLAAVQPIEKDIGVDIWSIDAGQPTGVRLGGHSSVISAVAFTPDAKVAATVSFDGSTRVWDVASGELLLGPLNEHAGRVLSAAFSPDGRILATGGADRYVYLYDVARGRIIGEPLTGHDNWVRSLRFNWQGNALYSATSEGRLVRWEIGRRALLEGHTDRVRALALSPDGRLLATASYDRQVLVWDAQQGRPLIRFRSPHQNAVLQVAFNADGTLMATGDAGGLVALWDLVKQEERGRWKDDMGDVVIGLAFSPDNRLLVAGHFSGKVSLFDLTDEALRKSTFMAHLQDGWVLSLAFSPDGALLATGSQSGKIYLWSTDEAASGELKAHGVLEGHTYWVTSLLWSSDGDTLISGSADGSVRFWNVASQQPSAPPLELEGQVWGVQFYPPHGERTLATLTGGGAIHLWDLATHSLLAPALRTALETESFAVSKQGDAVYLASFDDRLEKWRLDPQPWRRRSCAMAARALSEEEWRQFIGDATYRPVCSSLARE